MATRPDAPARPSHYAEDQSTEAGSEGWNWGERRRVKERQTPLKIYRRDGARAMWGARKKSGWGVSWTTSELSASTPTSGRLQPRTRENGARRRNKGRNVTWQSGSLQRKPGLYYGMQ